MRIVNQSVNHQSVRRHLTRLSGAVQQYHDEIHKNNANVWYSNLIKILVKISVTTSLRTPTIQHILISNQWSNYSDKSIRGRRK